MKARRISSRLLRGASWLLVQTTDYVQLRHTALVKLEVRLEDQPEYADVPPRPQMPSRGEWDREANRWVEHSPEAFARASKRYQRDIARYQRARERAGRAVLARLEAEGYASARFVVDHSGNPVMGRNLARRTRLMRAAHAARLAVIDRAIIRLQGQRKALLIRAWEQGIPVTSADLGTLSNLAELPTARKRWLRDRGGSSSGASPLDHTDTIWPPKRVPVHKREPLNDAEVAVIQEGAA